MNKRTKEEFIPRFNYITLSADRLGDGIAWDDTSNILEYQTVLSVGANVLDLQPGDKVKFERTAFPSTDVNKNPDAQSDIEAFSAEMQERIDALDKSKGPKKAKEAKREELRIEFQDKVKDLQEMGKAYAIPVMIDDVGDEFLWVSDRSVMFKFK